MVCHTKTTGYWFFVHDFIYYCPKSHESLRSPLFTGHPEYTVDSEAVLADHQQLKTKPEPKPKKTLDSDKKSKITGLKRAVTHG